MPSPPRRRSAVLILLAGATLIAAGGHAFGQGQPFAAPGEGVAGAPSNDLVAWIMAEQARFYRAMQAAGRAAQQGGGMIALYGLAFLYGLFHAAGPGHGKLVISSYVVANEKAAWRAVAVSFGAALVQALVALAVVGGLIYAIGLFGAARARAIGYVELAGYLALVGLGAVLVWRKAGALRALAGRSVATCAHDHLPDPDRLARGGWRDLATAALVAGLRPCTGAIIMLTFLIGLGLHAAGVVTVFAMALGVAAMTSTLALLAAFAKGFALRLASGRGGAGARAVAALELAAAAAVFGLGVLLVAGYLRFGAIAA
jgi:ABC-type nickel/cobalt efflux system permease component RcnA